MSNDFRFRMVRLNHLLVSLILVSAVVLSACAPAAVPAAESEAPATAPEEEMTPATSEGGMLRPAGEPQHGGVLKTAFGVTVSHFDIHQGGGPHVLGHMYNNLVRRNLVDGLRTVVPDLAESWEISDDGLTYTFNLREGVTYHDGTPFSSADVVATFNRIMDPPEGVVSVFKDEFTMVDSVEAIDELTVQFNLNAPRTYFLDLLAGTGMVVYSAKHLEENNNDLREVVVPGTGAFKYVEYLTAEKWILERNDDYWDAELPYLDGLELLHVPAWSDRGSAVLTGQAE